MIFYLFQRDGAISRQHKDDSAGKA